MKQKHEKFEVCIGIEAANEFLDKSHIHPKSLSVDEKYEYDDKEGKGTFEKYFFIGYTESKKEHHFKIEQFEVSKQVGFVDGLNGGMQLIEKQAAKYDGVVCQDISFDDGGLIVFFLVAEKQKED